MVCQICGLSSASKCARCKKDTCDLHLLKKKKLVFFTTKYCQHCFYETGKKSVFD